MAENTNDNKNSEFNPDDYFKKAILLMCVVMLLNVLFYIAFPSSYPTETTPTETVAVEDDTTVTESTTESTVVGTENFNMDDRMEYLGKSKSTTKSPVSFYYYRDTATDEMYIVTVNGENINTSLMLNSVTGKPLTYS